MVGSAAGFAFVILLPLYRACIPSIPIQITHQSYRELQQLTGLLAFPPGLASFNQFLQREFSVENLLFWCRVNQFIEEELKQSHKASEWLAIAFEIYQEFIADTAMKQVNLSHRHKIEVQITLKNLSIKYYGKKDLCQQDLDQLKTALSSLFLQAQKETFSLMVDAHSRYVTSELWAELIAEVEKGNQNAALIQSMSQV